MDWESSFDWYLEHLCEALQHNDRNAGLIGYCQGLMLPLRRKSVEPLAAHLEPDRVSARHQSLHHSFRSRSGRMRRCSRVYRQWVLPHMDPSNGIWG